MRAEFHADFASLHESPVKILLASVPHSGTQFFVRLLRPTMQAHFLYSEFHRLASEADIIVCPIRQPESVWQSWWNRGKAIDGRPPAEFFRSWEVLAAAARSMVFVSIDHDQRDDLLGRLTTVMGSPLLADWTKVVNGSVAHEPAPRVDLDEVYRIPIVAELYGRGA